MFGDCFDFPTDWKETRKAILRQRSALLGAPKHYGKQSFSDRLSGDEEVLDRFSVVSLKPAADVSGKLDYPHLWGDISEQLQISYTPVSNCRQFMEALVSLMPQKKVLFILHVKSGNKTVCIELLDSFQQLSHERSYLFLKYFTVLVLDDLSLYFYELSIRDRLSFWDFFQFKHRIPLFTDIVSVNEFLKGISVYSDRTSSLSNIIMQLTGGHQGMVYELLGFVAEEQPSRDSFRKECRERLLRSPIIESIRQTLLKSPAHPTLALSYKQRKIFNDIGPIMEDLFRVGIVLRADSVDAVLCSGIVTDIVETANNIPGVAKPSPPVKENDLVNVPGSAQTVREIFFSYKHSVNINLIKELYEKSNACPGYRGIIDDKDFPFGESISAFAHRIGEGNFVVVAISDEYIRSEHCMFEFYELYRHSQLDADKMMKKLFPVRLEEINLNDSQVYKEYIRYWREKKEEWDDPKSENADQVISRTHEKVRSIYNNLREMLEVINDIKALSPEILTADNFDSFLHLLLSRKH